MARELDVRVATVSDRENSGDDVSKGEGVSWEIWLSWTHALGLAVDWKLGDAVSDGWKPRNPLPTSNWVDDWDDPSPDKAT